MALTVAELLVKLHGDTASYDAAMLNSAAVTKAVAKSIEDVGTKTAVAGGDFGFLGESIGKVTGNSVNLLTAMDAADAVLKRLVVDVEYGAVGMAALGSAMDSTGNSALGTAAKVAVLNHELEKESALWVAIQGIGAGKSALVGGGRFGAAFAVIAALNQIFPLTTMAASIAVAAGSIALVGVALGGVAVGAAAVLFQWKDLLPKTSALSMAMMGVKQNLFQTGQALLGSNSLGAGLTSITNDINLLIGQATPMLSGFIQKLAGLGHSFAGAFLGQSNGPSIFQQWGKTITNFIGTAGTGLMRLFVGLQQPAQALVKGIGSVISAFGNSAIFSPGLIALTTTTIQKFFGVLAELVPILEKFSTTMDSVGITVLDFIHNLMPAISAAFTIFGDMEKVAAAIIGTIGRVIGVLLRIPVLGSVVQFLLGLAGAFALLIFTLDKLKLGMIVTAFSNLFAVMRSGSTFGAALAASFPRLAAFVGGAADAVGSFFLGISAGTITLGTMASALVGIAAPAAVAALALAPLVYIGYMMEKRFAANAASVKSLTASLTAGTLTVSALQARNAAILKANTPAAVNAQSGIAYPAGGAVNYINQLTDQYNNNKAAIAAYQKQVETAASKVNDFSARQILMGTAFDNTALATAGYVNSIKEAIAAQAQLTGPGMAQIKSFAAATGQSFRSLAQTVTNAWDGLVKSPDLMANVLAQARASVDSFKAGVVSAFGAITVKANESVAQFTAALNKMGTLAAQEGKNLDTISKATGKAGQAMIQALVAQGPVAAGLVAHIAGLSKKGIEQTAQTYNSNMAKVSAFSNKAATDSGAVFSAILKGIILMIHSLPGVTLTLKQIHDRIFGLKPPDPKIKAMFDAITTSVGNVTNAIFGIPTSWSTTLTVNNTSALAAVAALTAALGSLGFAPGPTSGYTGGPRGPGDGLPHAPAAPTRAPTFPTTGGAARTPAGAAPINVTVRADRRRFNADLSRDYTTRGY